MILRTQEVHASASISTDSITTVLNTGFRRLISPPLLVSNSDLLPREHIKAVAMLRTPFFTRQFPDFTRNLMDTQIPSLHTSSVYPSWYLE
ncbi:unnamed protein product [Protopolystoma xenopodis]|uniref:Uncharacterized protein n=1 Tax=Protopolystoma xenopodis TaxID=117903 RepID=A0A448XII4_9PLAT|nr:unnamed protein product [Protopolystoma xenopodis]